MSRLDTRVLIVGGGAAGITAAIGLARRQIPVTVLEGAIFPGAENWSGSIYFCENLARPEILGEELLEQTPLERRIVQRGLLASDGRVAPGFSVKSREAFAHCYSVLRPVFDHDLAQKARLFGAEVLSGTTALALIRDGDQVKGVLTDRGPIYAEVVFLAEGDASNLVGREGLETKAPGADGLVRPEFLQGIKEVLELPAGAIEERFGLQDDEGAALEILLRNATFEGKTLPLNAGTFLYTNRNSISIGIVAPLENISAFRGEHNRLMEWLKNQPALKPLLEGARSVSFGTKLIRGGGFKEMPRMTLDGLAVGGAASGIGVDFPCPNYTGPATFMGWAFAEAVAEILGESGAADFGRDALEERYTRRVQQSHYLADVEHLQNWPEFVGSAKHFFGQQVDLACQLSHVATDKIYKGRKRNRLLARTFHACLPPSERKEFRQEMQRATAALGVMKGVGKDIPLCLFWWTLNLIIGWWPRKTKTGAELIPHFLHSETDRRKPGWLIRYTRWVMSPGIAEALFHLYRNDGAKLSEKLHQSRRALLFRLNWLDFLVLGAGGAFFGLRGKMAASREAGRIKRKKLTHDQQLALPYRAQADAAKRHFDLDQVKDRVAHDDKLSRINYRSDERTHIRFHTAYDAVGLPDNSRASTPLFSVCPAKVYKDESDLARNVSVAVLHENCIRCESCWRADDRHVDWGRTRGQRLVFETYTPADAWLRESREAAGLADSRREHSELPANPEVPAMVRIDGNVEPRVRAALGSIARHARAFRHLHEHLPSVVTGADRSLLAVLGNEVLRAVEELSATILGNAEASQLLSVRANALQSWADRAKPRITSQRFFQFEADLELLRVHHLADFAARTGLELPSPKQQVHEVAGPRRLGLRSWLESVLDRDEVQACEDGLEPTPAARGVIFKMVSALLNPKTGALAHPGTPARDASLEELARISPALAATLAGHLAATDLVFRETVESSREGALEELREDFSRGRVLAGVLRGDYTMDENSAISGHSSGCLLGGVGVLLMPTGDGFCLLTPGDEGFAAEITGGLGLRGAGPGRLALTATTPRAFFSGEPGDAWLKLRASWDLVAVARGLAHYMAERAFDHATSRVQFPGMFKDFRGRDALAKFGAVQAMLAGITENLEVLESLRGRQGSGRLAAALAIDLIAPSPKSISYLAGQVLGGTAYSEEDPIARFYRDACTLTRLPGRTYYAMATHGECVLERFVPGEAALPGLQIGASTAVAIDDLSPLLASACSDANEAAKELTRGLRDLGGEERQAFLADLGKAALWQEGLRSLAQRVLAQLDAGVPDATSAAALEGFAQRVANRLRRLAARLGDGAALMELGRKLMAGTGPDGHSGADGALYADYLEDGQSFTSGDLFLKPKGKDSLMYSPEMRESDPHLASVVSTMTAEWKQRFEKGSYGRKVEELHLVPMEDLQLMVDEGYFRLIIPKDQLGGGAKKAHYYATCQVMMRDGDPSQTIILMGSTSIGTMPILIGLNEDLPKVRRALEGALAKPDAIDALAPELERIMAMVKQDGCIACLPDWKAASKSARAALSAKALRLAFGPLNALLSKAGKALKRDEAEKFQAAATQAKEWLGQWKSVVKADVATLPDREAAHTFYLRLIASGAMSAFALTEPSAGSDTARIRTKSERVSTKANRDPRGFWTFTPVGVEDPSVQRNLFTYDCLEVTESGVFFIRPDRHRVEVVVRDYDRNADSKDAAAGKVRYVELDGERIDIHDIGRVRSTDNGHAYDYFRTNGAKMWITNGSTAGVMILYTLTERGPTGLMLDAHAEGLVVGKDEEKMGQRGSATNELALSDVRIPVDQIIGIEGRGQENALETLNVGRSGLAISCTALMQGLIDEVREGLHGAELSPHELIELGRMALDLVSAESVAYQLVGLFDHAGTRSVRVESALAKAQATEALHRMITRAERILPQAYALDAHTLEKRRRDARVLTIYEGTNEIQRFLMLRDLVDVLDLDALETGDFAGDSAAVRRGRESLDGERRELVQRLKKLRADFGPRAWAQSHLQPWVFELVEAFMACSSLSSTLHRTSVAHRLCAGDAGQARREFLDEASALLAKDLKLLQISRFARFDQTARRLADGRDLGTQVVADRALLRYEAASESTAPALASRIEGDEALRVLVVIDPKPVVAPEPRVAGHRLHEHTAELSESDRFALHSALMLRAGGPVAITVLGTGRISGVDILEECLALGADDAFLVNTGTHSLLSPEIAGAVCDVIRTREDLSEHMFDLVLGSEDHSALLLPLARRLSLDPVKGILELSAHRTAEPEADPTFRAKLERPEKTVDLPAHCLLMTAGATPGADLVWTVEGWRRAKRMSVSVIDFTPEDRQEIDLAPAMAAASSTNGAEHHELTLDDAVRLFAEETGLSGGGEAAGPYEGDLGRAQLDACFDGLKSLAVGEAHCNDGVSGGVLAAVRAATATAAANKGKAGLLLLTKDETDEDLRALIGQVRGHSDALRIVIVAWAELERLTQLSRAHVITGVLSAIDAPIYFAPELRDAALMATATQDPNAPSRLIVDGVDRIGFANGSLRLEGLRFERKVRFGMERPLGESCEAIVTSDLLVVDEDLTFLVPDAQVTLLDEVPLVESDDRLADILRATEEAIGGSLSDAEFVIDVGYGVGSRDGIEEVVDPLKEALEALGVKRVTIGATRKVTQDLGILPDSLQIGQTGVPVAPKIMLCLGVSGAPQHLEYIAPSAVIFAFNKDPDCPLMALNRTRPRPIVHPIVGDLFKEVPRFMDSLRAHLSGAAIEA